VGTSKITRDFFRCPTRENNFFRLSSYCTVIPHYSHPVQLRYAITTVETHLKNAAIEASEVVFSMIIPDEAFVSNFTMTLNGGTEIVAEVKDKQEAANTYTEAVEQGQAAGLVEAESKYEGQLVS
jgi:hypothetical protein